MTKRLSDNRSVTRATTVDRAAEELRRALFEGELQPGTPLREVALAESLGVSRSTVREVLGVLVAEGLADRTPNKGTQVRRLDLEQVRDVSLARRVIETAGVRNWIHSDEASRQDLRRALATYSELRENDSSTVPTSTAQFTAAHLAIHRALTGLAGSSRLVALADSLHAEIRLALAEVDRARGNAAEQVHSHSYLLDLLEAGDIDAASDALGAHLLEAEESMIEVVADRLTTLAP